MKYPGYREAIRWMVNNDDTEWVFGNPQEGGGALSVTASMVADLFGVEDERVRKDLARALAHRRPQ